MTLERLEDNSYFSCPFNGRSIDADFPFLFSLFLRWFLVCCCEFGYEIGEGLGLDGLSQTIFDIELTQFMAH